MKIMFTVDQETIRGLIAEHIKAKTNIFVTPYDVKIKVKPIRERRKHPTWCPIEHATVQTKV